MTQLIGIIADDLTGANDSGVQLTEKGINTSVLFDIPKHKNNLDSGIVIDTNSRALSKQEAKLITEQASLFLKEAGYRYIYKKMDSTLRGHIGTELQAVYDIFQPEFVIIAPAFPPYGRTTKDGIHYVNGIKIADTESSRDPKHPVLESYIPKLIENEIGEPVGLITKLDSNNLHEKLKIYKENNIHYIVCDAESQNDLQSLAQNLIGISEKIVWAGSAGLAEVLPNVLGIAQEIKTPNFTNSKRVMTVCGSLSQMTQDQVKFASGQQGIRAVEIDTLEMFTEQWELLSKRYIAQCIAGLEEGKDIVLYVPSTVEIRNQVKKIGTKLNLSGYQIGERISQDIGLIVNEVAKINQEITGFVLTGGDTAKDVCRQLGGIGFRLIKQIEPGIPLGTLIGSCVEYKVITKAGAFGTQNSIYHAMQALKGVHNNE